MLTVKAISCFLLLGVLAGLMAMGSCAKEYSCEECLTRDTVAVRNPVIIIQDTTRIDSTLRFETCGACDSTKPLAVNTWSFRNYRSYMCGVVNYAYFDPGKMSFGLGGNPECTADTGFILNADFSPLSFTTDRFNVSTTSQSFLLRDNKSIGGVGFEYVLRTNGTTPSNTLTVVVDTFLNSTKLMVGRFYGYAYTKESHRSYIDGRFRLTFH